ncbi:hypothetical protein FSARC_11182 [Fusarium sarcochroum]|uniref:NmrA-like domain-containing protein n=1 Tax=Fusarium sarcochroum TaxID=1208366 RepID=A0A8H4THC5_9HYPO|nr:hypothetical protein FSARC_11182 [Fusarium sarcochroum]
MVTSGRIQHAKEFDSKAEIEEFIRDLNIPAAFVVPGFYMNLFVPGNYLARSSDDPDLLQLELLVPTESSVIPLIDMNKDFGKFVVSILLDKDSFVGRRIFVAEGYYSLDGMAAAVDMSEPIHGYKCATREMNDDEFLGQDPISGSKIQNEDLSANSNIVAEPLLSYAEFVRKSELFLQHTDETHANEESEI